MKNNILIFIIISIIFIVLLYPRKIIHAVFIESNGDYSICCIDGNLKKVKISGLTFDKYTVLNFKYNILGIHSVEKVNPISNRIMIKNNDLYELEAIGEKRLSKKPNFYKIDENNNISVASSKDIIVGKTNVKTFFNKNNLKTFFIYPVDYSTTRVAITTTNFNSIYHKDLDITCNSPCKIYSLINDYSLDVPKGTNIKASFNGRDIQLNIGSISKTFSERIYLKNGPFTVNNISRGYPSFSPTYNGTLELYPSKDGIIVINEINIEDYLTRVVPSEMPSFGGLEALKCQAVAARTYAISDMLSCRFANLGFYVDDSTKSQVYNNIKEVPIATKAVRDTSGLIMTFNNKPIDAKYYSTSSGTGVNHNDIWFKSNGEGDYAPYLKTSSYINGVFLIPETEEDWLKFYKDTTIDAFDKDSPYFRWNLSYDKDLLEKNLNINLRNIYETAPEYISLYKNHKSMSKIKDFPKELQNLENISVIKRSEGGNLIEISFAFENAIVNIKKDTYIRRAFKNNFNTENIQIIRHNGEPLDNWTTLPSSFFSIEKSKDKFLIYGGGYGHGVGMSQYGAMYLGSMGKSFEDILNTYYNGIQLKKL